MSVKNAVILSEYCDMTFATQTDDSCQTLNPLQAHIRNQMFTVVFLVFV